MTANRTVGRKQMVVTGLSVLLAIGSCFIPLRDPTPPASSKVERTLDPSLPSQQPALDYSAPAAAAAKILLAAQRTGQAKLAASATGDSGVAAPADPAIGAPPLAVPKQRQEAVAPPQAGQPGAAQPLSSQDFHSGAPDLKLMQILPVNQSGQF